MQAAHGVAAIIAVLGFEPASVFGTSQGGVIAFHIGVFFPDKLGELVAHESPTFGLLPGMEGAMWVDFVTRTYGVFKTKGPGPAMKLFLRMTRGWRSTSQDEVSEVEVLDPLQPGSDAEVDDPSLVEDADLLPVAPDQFFWLEYEFLTAICVPTFSTLSAIPARVMSKWINPPCHTLVAVSFHPILACYQKSNPRDLRA